MIEILRKNKTTIISTLVGILFSGIITYYFFIKSISGPEPIFLIDPIRTELINSKSFEQTKLKILRGDGSEIKGDISSIRFYFWNHGYKNIKSNNILSPIIISIVGEDAEILDYQILKQSRKVVNSKLNMKSDYELNKLTLSFDILEEKDGIIGQIIFKGKLNSEVSIEGEIEGVRKIGTGSSQINIATLEIVLGLIIVMGVIIGGSFLLYFIGDKLSFTVYKISKKSIPNWIRVGGKMFSYFYVALVVLVVLLVILIKPIMCVHEYAQENISNLLPKQLKPD